MENSQEKQESAVVAASAGDGETPQEKQNGTNASSEDQQAVSPLEEKIIQQVEVGWVAALL